MHIHLNMTVNKISLNYQSLSMIIIIFPICIDSTNGSEFSEYLYHEGLPWSHQSNERLTMLAREKDYFYMKAPRHVQRRNKRPPIICFLQKRLLKNKTTNLVNRENLAITFLHLLQLPQEIPEDETINNNDQT